jgi:hypothetical protein
MEERQPEFVSDFDSIESIDKNYVRYITEPQGELSVHPGAIQRVTGVIAKLVRKYFANGVHTCACSCGK